MHSIYEWNCGIILNIAFIFIYSYIKTEKCTVQKGKLLNELYFRKVIATHVMIFKKGGAEKKACLSVKLVLKEISKR